MKGIIAFTDVLKYILNSKIKKTLKKMVTPNRDDNLSSINITAI